MLMILVREYLIKLTQAELLHEADNGDHLYDWKQKFRFTISSDSEEVYANDKNQKKRNPCSWRDGWIPVLDRNSGSNDLKR